MDRGTWWAAVHGAAELDTTERHTRHAYLPQTRAAPRVLLVTSSHKQRPPRAGNLNTITCHGGDSVALISETRSISTVSWKRPEKPTRPEVPQGFGAGPRMGAGTAVKAQAPSGVWTPRNTGKAGLQRQRRRGRRGWAWGRGPGQKPRREQTQGQARGPPAERSLRARGRPGQAGTREKAGRGTRDGGVPSAGLAFTLTQGRDS